MVELILVSQKQIKEEVIAIEIFEETNSINYKVNHKL